MTVRTRLESVVFAPVPAELSEALAAAFSGPDAEELLSMRLQTAAGRLALKRAATGLLRELAGIEILPRDVRVVSEASGKPRIEWPAGLEERARAAAIGMHVSISHSRSIAVAAASAEVDEGAP